MYKFTEDYRARNCKRSGFCHNFIFIVIHECEILDLGLITGSFIYNSNISEKNEKQFLWKR